MRLFTTKFALWANEIAAGGSEILAFANVKLRLRRSEK